MVNSPEAPCVLPLKLCRTALQVLHCPCPAAGAARKLMNGCSALRILRILLICIFCLTRSAFMHVSMYPKAFGSQLQASV